MSPERHTPADEPFFLVRTLASEYPDGASIPTHAHPWGQLIHVASGVATVVTGQGSWVAPPRWAIFAPAGVEHGLRFAGRARLLSLYFRPALPGQPERATVVAVSPLLSELCSRAAELGMLDERKTEETALVTLVLAELRVRPTATLDLPWPSSAHLRRVAEELAASPRRRTSHGELARQCGTSVRTLERGFQQETGLALGHWARQARFLHALRRMGAGAAVKLAAREAGYSTPSAFVAAFRAQFGTTPGRYFDTEPG